MTATVPLVDSTLSVGPNAKKVQFKTQLFTFN